MDPVHVLFDIECQQGKDHHIPNLLVCQRGGEEDDVYYPFWGKDCVEQFLRQLEDWCEGGDQPLTVLAHNFQGYDAYPILDTLLEMGHTQPQQVRNGGKVLQLTCFDKVRFIDSMSFFQMKLAAFPKTFGLEELRKGYFPHLFNVEANQEYLGPLPDQHYYMPQNMSPKEKEEFEKWHDRLRTEDYVFDFKQELLAYCQSDVLLLKQGCLTFMRDFEEKAGFDPFDSMTIAFACNKYLRTHCLEPGTIAVEPPHGWGSRRVNQSKVALEWLTWRAHQDQVNILHSHHGGEQRPLEDHPHWTVDGLDWARGTVYEFDGCFWHGCPTCYPQRHETHTKLLDLTMDDVCTLRERKHALLRERGFQVISIWECQWNEAKKNNADVQAFLQEYRIPEPLNPPDAFFGGRTNAYRLYYKVQRGEKIFYYDYKSLYPYVNKYGRYPVGHPEIISQPPVEDVLDRKFFGLIRCTVVPPTDLYHPVLPYKYHKKLTFPLCAACVHQYIDTSPLEKAVDDCDHSDNERALKGTWCTPELYKALDKGYRLLHADQMYHWDEETQTRVGLFGDYIDTWLQLKEEASGYPDDCTTEEEREDHRQEWEEHEGIVLDPDQIEYNPGKRTLSKQMLNSMWGKFGQAPNKTQVKNFLDPAEFQLFMASGKHKIKWVSPLGQEHVEVHYKMKEHCYKDSPCVNIFVAAFTTCWARLHLYEALDHLGERALYSDTDSVIFVNRSGDPPIQPPLGNLLGDFTNELKPGDFIEEFCSGGPKNYGHRTAQGKEECKVRGFSLNVEGRAQLNYRVLRQNTLDELYHPLAKARKLGVKQTYAIGQDAQWYRLRTHSRTKQYRMVYSKRIVDPETKLTYPYGYRSPEMDAQDDAMDAQDHQNVGALLELIE